MKLNIGADVDNFSHLGCWTVQSHLHTKSQADMEALAWT